MLFRIFFAILRLYLITSSSTHPNFLIYCSSNSKNNKHRIAIIQGRSSSCGNSFLRRPWMWLFVNAGIHIYVLVCVYVYTEIETHKTHTLDSSAMYLLFCVKIAFVISVECADILRDAINSVIVLFVLTFRALLCCLAFGTDIAAIGFVPPSLPLPYAYFHSVKFY